MKRREFLKAGIGGAAGASTVCVLQNTLCAAESQPAAPNVDPDSVATAAVEHFLAGKRTCGESILLAGCETLGIENELVPDIALGLAGGIGLQGKTCGTISGAAMVLSLGVASRETDYQKKKMQVFKAAGAMCKRFENQFGTTECRKLSGLDLTTAEGRKVLQQRVKAEKCRNFVEAAARMLAQSLAEAVQ